MNTLSFHLGVAVFHLSFVNEKGANAALQKYLDAEKDDPQGNLTLSDDYSEKVVFKPADVKMAFIIDKDREIEIMVQNALREVRTKIEQQQRIQGDAKIVAASKAIPAGALQNIQQGGNA